jgi:hypothetical protein
MNHALDRLLDAENALRDFATNVLSVKDDNDWVTKAGVDSKKLASWVKKREVDRLKRSSNEIRAIYYSDLSHLLEVIDNNWSQFSSAFHDRNSFEAVGRLWTTLRNGQTHGRALLPSEEALAVGLAGRVRTLIAKARSHQLKRREFFPVFECAYDNYDNLYSGSDNTTIISKIPLYVGMDLEFSVRAADPFEEDLLYYFRSPSDESHSGWQDNLNVWQRISSWKKRIIEEDIGVDFYVRIAVRSPREHKAHFGYDDLLVFKYEVYPRV